MHGVPRNHVRLVCSDPKVDLTVLMGAEPPKVSGGGGGWEVVERPRQVSMTIYKGRDPFELELDVMLDQYDPPRRSQEPAIRELLAGLTGDDESEPSTWEILGLALPVDEWVLNAAEPGDAVIRRGDASRLRQSYTLTFVEYTPPQYVQLRRRARQGSKGKTTVIRVRKGDTPAKIARKRRCKWTDLRTLNRGVVTKANQDLKDGSRIRVPVLREKPGKKGGKKR